MVGHIIGSRRGRAGLTRVPLFPGALLKADRHHVEESHVRHRRSTPQLKVLPLSEETDSRANLSELLARLLSTRKGARECVCLDVNKNQGLRGIHACLPARGREQYAQNFQKQMPFPSVRLPFGVC